MLVFRWKVKGSFKWLRSLWVAEIAYSELQSHPEKRYLWWSQEDLTTHASKISWNFFRNFFEISKWNVNNRVGKFPNLESHCCKWRDLFTSFHWVSLETASLSTLSKKVLFVRKKRVHLKKVCNLVENRGLTANFFINEVSPSINFDCDRSPSVSSRRIRVKKSKF